jgi:hypothetical protein
MSEIRILDFGPAGIPSVIGGVQLKEKHLHGDSLLNLSKFLCQSHLHNTLLSPYHTQCWASLGDGRRMLYRFACVDHAQDDLLRLLIELQDCL